MRIVIVAHPDYDFTYRTLARLLPCLGEHDVHIVLSPPVIPVQRYLAAFGPAISARLALQSCTAQWGKSFRALGVPVVWTDNPEATFDADLCINFTGHIFPPAFLARFPSGVLNKHAALLPYYRGILPVFWAMHHGDPIGFTIHRMDAQIDHGPVFWQHAYPTTERHSLYAWYQKISDDAGLALAQVIRDIGNGSEGTPQPTGGSYYSFPTRDDVRAFLQKGNQVV